MKAPAAILAAVLILLGCTQAQESRQAVRVVQTQVAAAASLPDATAYSGEVRARHEADLGFRMAGKIAARLVDTGSAVRKGQVLARLDPADSQSNADAAQPAAGHHGAHQ